MRRRRRPSLTVLALLGASLLGADGPLGYDPAADPDADLDAAVVEARATGRRILMVVGGEWCSWCHILDRFVKGNEAIQEQWTRGYVTLKVHWDREQPNEDFLAQYPPIPGYPHIFVLEDDGTLLHSQSTAELEYAESYSPDLVTAFLERWAPPGRPPTGNVDR